MENDRGNRGELNQSFTFSRKPNLEPLTPEQEKRIVFGATQGNAEDFGRLAEHYGHDIYKHIYYMIGNHHDAEDLAGQTLLNAMRAIERYEHRGVPIKSWFLRIAHNAGISHIRAKRDNTQIHNGILDTKTDVSASAETNEELSFMERAMSMLSGDQRRVIHDRFVLDHDYETVAENLGRTPGAIRVLQHRGLKSLKRKMAMIEQGELSGTEQVA